MPGQGKQQPRPRISVLCTECKRRKVKCDHKLPCLACIRYQAPGRCAYLDDHIVTSSADFPGSVSVYRQQRQPDRLSTPLPAPSVEGGHVIDGLRDLGKAIDSGDVYGQVAANGAGNFVSHHNNPHGVLSGDRVPAMATPFLNDHVVFLPVVVPPPGVLHHMDVSYQSQAPSLLQIPAYQRPGNSPYSVLPSNFPHTPPSLDQIHYTNAEGRPFYNPPNISSNFQAGSGKANIEEIQRLPHIHRAPQSFTDCDESPERPEKQRRLEKAADHVHLPAKEPARYPEVLAIGPVNHSFNNPSPSSRSNSVLNLLNEDSASRSLPQNKWIGENPYDTLDPNETFDLFGGYNLIYTGTNGSCINHGPLSWYAYIYKDIILRSVCLYVRVVHEKDSNYVIPTLLKDSAFLKKSQQEAERNKTSLPLCNLGGGLKKRLLSLGLTFYEGDVDVDISLTDRIKLMLPSKRAVSFFVSHFFEVIYPYLPIIDEAYFRKHIQRILGTFSDTEEAYTEIHVTKRYDYANLGILLLLLRITHLSGLSNDNSVNESIIGNDATSISEQSKFILNNPINIDVMHCAQLCLNQYSLYQRTNLTVLQCAVMIRVYLNIAPESGDAADGHEDNSFNVTCIQIAYCMGLNKDPSSIHDHTPNVACDHLRRKLWYFIKFLDIRLAYHFGSPMMVDSESYDTKVPFYFPGCSNVADENLEKVACEAMQVSESLCEKGRVMLLKCTSLKSPWQVRELTVRLSEFEHAVSNKLGTLSELLNDPSELSISSHRRVHFLRLHLVLKSFILAIFYHLLLNYEKAKKFELSFFYLRKFVAISCGEFLIHVIDLIKNKHFQLDSCVPGLILNPPLVLMIQRTNHVNFRLVAQLNCMISRMERDQKTQSNDVGTDLSFHSKLSRARKLVRLLENLVKYCNGCFQMLGHRFFLSWKLSKVHSSLLKSATSELFPEHCLELQSKSIPLSDLQITELLGIVENTWTKIRQKCSGEPTKSQKLTVHNHGARVFQNALSVTGTEAIDSDHLAPKYYVKSTLAYTPDDHLAKESYPIGGSPGYTTELPESFLSNGLANLDIGNIEEMDNFWLQLGSKLESDGFWQRINLMKGD